MPSATVFLTSASFFDVYVYWRRDNNESEDKDKNEEVQ